MGIKILAFWWEWLMVELAYLVVILLSYVLFYPAYVLKFKLGLNWLNLFLNDETIYGEQWWLDREGLKEGQFLAAIKWHWRNPAWNFHLYFKPEGDHSEVEIEKIYKQEGEGNPLRWCNRDRGHYGHKHIYYKASGIFYGRYSYADKDSEIMLGTSGMRYVCRIKGIGQLLKKLIKPPK